MDPVLEAQLKQLVTEKDTSIQALDKVKEELIAIAKGYTQKSAFLTEIELFAEAQKKKAGTDPKKVKSLTKEIHRTLEAAIKKFSARRSAGQHEEDDDENEEEEDEDEASLEFLDAADSTNKMLGPHIPTERRMVLAQIIEKMASVWKEKKANKVGIVQRWRIIRLSEKLKLLRNQNLGYMLLSKIFDKRRNSFYKIQEVGSVRKEQKLQSLVVPGTPAKSKAEIESLSAKLRAAEDQIAKLTKENADLLSTMKAPGSPTKGLAEIATLKKEIDELRQQLLNSENEVGRLTRENNDLKSKAPPSPSKAISEIQKLKDALEKELADFKKKFAASESTVAELRAKVAALEKEKADLLNKQPSPAPSPKLGPQELETLRNKVLNYEKEIKALKDANKQLMDQIESMGNNTKEVEVAQPQKVKEKNSVVTRTITKVIQAPEKLPVEHFGTVLTDLKKARIVSNIVRHLEIRQAQKTFCQILKSGIKAKRSMGEASLRMKGRLLQIMHQKYCDVGGAQKAFLRWWVVTHNTFQRDCITKVALNARITHQNALWRFRKMVRKNVKVRLPEAVRKNRYTSGLYLLDALVRADHLIKHIESFNAIRPAINGRRNKLLVKIITRKAEVEEMQKLHTLHKIVNEHRNRKSLLQKFLDKILQKELDAFHKLVDNGKIGGKNNREDKLKKLLDRLLRNSQAKQKAAQDNLREYNKNKKLQDRLNKILKDRFLNNLMDGQLGHLQDAFKRLRDNRAITIIKDLQAHTVVEVTKVIRQKKNVTNFHDLKEAQKSKMGEALSKLRKNNNDIGNKEKDRMNKLKKVADRLQRAGKGKEQDAVDALQKFVNDISRRDTDRKAKLKNMLNKLANGSRGRVGQAFDNLKTFNIVVTKETVINVNTERLVNRLKNKSSKDLTGGLKKGFDNLMRDALNKLRDFNDKAKEREISNLRNKKNLMKALNRAANGKTGEALNKLLNNLTNQNNDTIVRELKERIVNEKAKNRLGKLFDNLKKGQSGKEQEAFKELRDQNSRLKSVENIEDVKNRHNKKLKNKTLIGLINAQMAKELQAFYKLNDNQKKIQMEESEKNFEKTLKDAKEKDRRRNIINKLFAAMGGKKGAAMKKLIDNAVGQRYDEESYLLKQKRDKERTDHMLKALLNRMMEKRNEAFSKLFDNAKVGSVGPEVIKKNKLVQDLINKQKAIEAAALRKLLQNNRNAANEDQMNKDRKQKLLRSLLSAHDKKGKDALNKLLNNSKAVQNIEKESFMKFKHYLDKLGDIGSLKTRNDKVTCYNKMKDFANQKKRENDLRKKIINALIKGSQGKEKNALYNLRQNNLLIWGEQKLNETMNDLNLDKELNAKKKLFKRLFKVYGTKSSSALKQLRYNNDALKGKENQGQQLLDKLMFKAKNNSTNKAADAYRKMKEYAKKNKEYENKFKSILNNIITRTAGNNKLSLMDALNKLGKNKNELNQKNTNQMNKTKVLLNKLVNASNAKDLDTLNRLKTNKAISTLTEKLRNKAVKGSGLASKIDTGLKNKLADAFNKLRVNALELDKKKILEEGKLKRLVNRLGNTMEKKLEEAFKELGSNKNKLRDNEKKVNDAKAKLINKLRDSIRNKLGNAADILANNGKNVGPAIDERNEALKKLLKHLKTGGQGQVDSALNQLLKNKEKETRKEQDRKRITDLLTRRLNDAYTNKKEQTLNLIKDKATKDREQQRANDQSKKKLMEKLINNLNNKVGDVFNKTRGRTRIIKEKEVIEKVRTVNVMNRVGRNYDNKLAEALDKLRRNNREIEEKNRRDNKLKKGMLNNLMDSLKDKEKKAMNKLADNLRSGMDKAMREKLLKTNMINKLLKSFTKKESEALDNLRDFLNKGALEKARKNAAVKRLLNALKNGSNSKIANAQDRLLKHKITTETEERKNRLLRNSAVKLFTEKIRDRIRTEQQTCMHKLVTNTLNVRVRVEKIIKTETIIKRSQQSKAMESIYKMQVSRLRQEVINSERRLKFNHVLQRMYRRLMKDGYQRLLKNAFLKQRIANVFNKAEKLNNRRMLKSGLEVFKDLIRKKSQSSLKLFDFLSGLIRTRELQAYSELKIRFQLGRREKLNKGLLSMQTFFKKATTTRVTESFLTIKRQFFVDNPWYRKAIQQLTIHTASNPQLAFWKIRLLKDIGQANVPPQTAIKLRQFAELIAKKKSRIMQATFTRLDITRTGGTDSMNMSFFHSATSPKIPKSVTQTPAKGSVSTPKPVPPK